MAIQHELIQINGIGDAILNKLIAGGIETIIDLSKAILEHIVQMEIAPAIATKIIHEAKQFLLPDDEKEKPEVKDKDKLAPSSRSTALRMRGKRHRAPRHRKR